MRLLNTKTLEFKEFFDHQIPRYAILSHRWEGGETTYSDFRKRRNIESQGHKKVLAFCRKARFDQYEWVWIDTCCIDKKSSAELSEAINSMMRWYTNADICYAYLSDLLGEDVKNVMSLREKFKDDMLRRERFEKSAWFTRGWTLQELLAPRNLIFLDRNWSKFGTKSELKPTISLVTGIREHLFEKGAWMGTSNAEKMSWASRRLTSRIEDEAYCLMGLFDVNMPLLYGEGCRAFLRLQEEILKISDDQSLLAWTMPDAPDIPYGFLASSPRNFSDLGAIDDCPFYSDRSSDLDSSIVVTNRGLLFQACLVGREQLNVEHDTISRLHKHTKQIIILPFCTSAPKSLAGTQKPGLIAIELFFMGNYEGQGLSVLRLPRLLISRDASLFYSFGPRKLRKLLLVPHLDSTKRVDRPRKFPLLHLSSR